ncbi:MAG: (Fe-S)-binding protein [archaeon]
MGLFDWMKGEKILYYPGCLTKGVLKEQFENYKEIFNRLGIDFILLPDKEVCCGSPVLNAGFKKDARKLAIKNLKLFKEKGITKIVTNCPACYHVFKEVYPTLMRDWDLNVEHATVTILKALKRKGIKWKGNEEDRELVSYHDPCHLGRYSGIYEEPREVIKLLGGKIIEMRNNRENVICCGGGGGVRANFPEIAKEAAKKKVAEIENEVGKIISPCGLCYANIKSATEKSTEFSNFVLGRLRGMR